MATHLKIKTIATLVVGLQLFDMMSANDFISIIFNTKLLKYVPSVTVVLAAELKLPTVNPNPLINFNFVPPPKGAPIRTQGSGAR
ncbi:hypothetical protein [Gloeocapsopsis dulcis]|uniref:Uncharacterized protein n=1 Tax=Gloeocapsopsis dulcis AAB1 = 1H9 TaxID=1433147 RepID=A0A6N8G3V3_9CHRO|nr:hypothetical protein [Gloeocapsopsis dulcis]MUL38716.1 hypothetical protein [Gloeocapsopsis dulcis AAB1 = 1H9]WNN88866.1 hypothetical protein P0S91_21780 [Gloeocapsopsis dulcis]